MKRALIFAALLALLALLSPLAHQTAQASGASITLAPGVTLNLGDRDRRGYYWDGGRWREPRWWNDRYSYNERRWWRHEEWRRHQQWERERRWHERDRERRWEHQHRRDRDWDHHDRRGPGPHGSGLMDRARTATIVTKQNARHNRAFFVSQARYSPSASPTSK